MSTASSIKDTFITELRKVERQGMNDLISWLETTDFFTAPASISSHNNRKFGLLVHSLNVYYSFKFDYVGLKSLPNYNVPDISEETIILCCLLHDINKVNIFKEAVDNNKQFCYKIEDNYIMDNSKSIHYIEKFMKLTDEEAQAIAMFRNEKVCKDNFVAFLLNRANELSKNFNENSKYKKVVVNNENQ